MLAHEDPTFHRVEVAVQYIGKEMVICIPLTLILPSSGPASGGSHVSKAPQLELLEEEGDEDDGVHLPAKQHRSSQRRAAGESRGVKTEGNSEEFVGSGGGEEAMDVEEEKEEGDDEEDDDEDDIQE